MERERGYYHLLSPFSSSLVQPFLQKNSYLAVKLSNLSESFQIFQLHSYSLFNLEFSDIFFITV